jgi:hypothetical protein
MGSSFLICCFGLLIISSLLVYFIRPSRTFGIYPGAISVVLFLILGSYLIYMIFSTNPGAPPKIKDYKTSVFLKIYNVREIQNKMDSYLANIEFLINLLIFQSLVCIASAIVGFKIVPVRRSYYRWLLVLHSILIPALCAAEYLMYHRHA